jgi:hypothetical protein
LAAKVYAIYSYISKQNIDNVPLQDLVDNNRENIDINYIKNFGTMGIITTTTMLMLSPPHVLTSILVVTMFLMI